MFAPHFYFIFWPEERYLDAGVATELDPPVNPFLPVGHSKLPSVSFAFDTNHDSKERNHGAKENGKMDFSTTYCRY